MGQKIQSQPKEQYMNDINNLYLICSLTFLVGVIGGGIVGYLAGLDGWLSKRFFKKK